jgi:hypothetical protein
VPGLVSFGVSHCRSSLQMASTVDRSLRLLVFIGITIVNSFVATSVKFSSNIVK